MICQALEDILEGVEFEGSKASLCEFQCLRGIAGISRVDFNVEG